MMYKVRYFPNFHSHNFTRVLTNWRDLRHLQFEKDTSYSYSVFATVIDLWECRRKEDKTMGCLTFTTSHLPRFDITVSCIIHHRAVKRAKQVQKTQRLYGRNATQTQFTCNLQVYYTQVHNSLVLPVFKHFYIAFNKEIY